MSISLIPPEHLLLNQLARGYGIEQSQLRCLGDDPGYGVYGFTRHGQDFFVEYIAIPAARADQPSGSAGICISRRDRQWNCCHVKDKENTDVSHSTI